jgi:hypothetical protein
MHSLWNMARPCSCACRNDTSLRLRREAGLSRVRIWIESVALQLRGWLFVSHKPAPGRCAGCSLVRGLLQARSELLELVSHLWSGNDRVRARQTTRPQINHGYFRSTHYDSQQRIGSPLFCDRYAQQDSGSAAAYFSKSMACPTLNPVV